MTFISILPGVLGTTFLEDSICSGSEVAPLLTSLKVPTKNKRGLYFQFQYRSHINNQGTQ